MSNDLRSDFYDTNDDPDFVSKIKYAVLSNTNNDFDLDKNN